MNKQQKFEKPFLNDFRGRVPFLNVAFQILFASRKKVKKNNFYF
jgi:hypothetical protein